MKNVNQAVDEHTLDGEEHIVFKTVTMLLVGRACVVPQVEKPGNGELVSYRVHSEIGARETELMVRIDAERGSYACWRLQEVGGKCLTMLMTFDAWGA